ncbi:tyrosine-type recombinase/integrase [Desulfobacterales bacterium HSG17]|nr:tyrosine-type recombinase/integrase [Desulfobacterales bacterium HSG17]
MGVKVREKKKDSGEWWVFIDHKGKRKAKKIGNNKRVALEVAKKIEAKLTLGDVGMLDNNEQPAIPIFKDYAETWLGVTVPVTCKSSTHKDYVSIMNIHVLPVFRNTPVDDITKMMVKKFLMEKIQKGFASSTVSHMKSCISGPLSLAVDDEVIAANPAQRLGKLFKKKVIKDDINPLTSKELSTLLSTFKEKYQDHFPVALTMARTGMRFGECLGLKWKDVDFDNRSIDVSRTFSRCKIDVPKNGKSRTVDMSNQLTAVLQKFKEQKKAEVNGSTFPEWVFTNSKGNPLDMNNWRKRVFYRTLKTAGVRQVRVHDLRHTYATLLIQAGESLAYVRDQLGHHSIQVTVDIYGHLTPGGNKAAVDRLDDVKVKSATKRNLSATKQKKGLTDVG